MSAKAWLIVAIVGFSLSGAALIGAAVLFFKLNIPGVIGDLTGKTVAREIKAIRDANASSESKAQKKPVSGAGHGAPAAYMAKAHASKRLDRTEAASRGGTSRDLGQKQRNITETLSTGSGSAERPTEVLSEEQAPVLPDVREERNGTTVLDAVPVQTEVCTRAVTFRVTRRQIVTHSDQIIK